MPTQKQHTDSISSIANQTINSDFKSDINDTKNHIGINDSEQIEIAKELINKSKKSKVKEWRTFFIFLFCAALVCVTIRIFCPVTAVSGRSMFPTYKDKQLLSTTSTIFRPIKRDVVAVMKNESTKGSYFIKRVVGVPGDTLEIRDGILYVNGKAENRDVEKTNDSHVGILSSPLTLGEDEYFLMGDNRNDSYDCRMFGAVNSKDIKYIVNFTIF